MYISTKLIDYRLSPLIESLYLAESRKSKRVKIGCGQGDTRFIMHRNDMK